MDQDPGRHVQCGVERGVLVLTITESKVQGEDVAAALREEMMAALERSDLSKVVVDFCNVRYISSAAFRPLLALRRLLQEKDGRLVLCGLNSVVGNIFRVTKMIGPGGDPTAIFDMEPDVSSAIARLVL